MSSRLRLGGEEYHALQRRVLEREANLITLCAGCHRQVHQGGEL